MITIQGYNFQGPWQLGQEFNNVSGVYAVYTSQLWLDFGETEQLGGRINGDNHERKPDWIRNAGWFPIWVAFLPETDSQKRLAIESYLRQTLLPICGDK